MKKIFLTIVSALLLISCSGNKEIEEKQQKEIEPTVLLTSTQLEKYGFEKIDAFHFILYHLDDGFILANYKDKNIIRYKSPEDVRQYNAAGQGPGEFLALGDIFKYDNKTIGVYDLIKKSVLLFDTDLNYKKEIKTNPKTVRIAPIKGSKDFVAFGFFDGNVFAILDRDFKIKETFIKEITKSRLPRMYPRSLNCAHFLNERKFAFTQNWYTEKTCRADIYNIDGKKTGLTLKWEQDRLPTKNDRVKLINRYSSYQIIDYDGFLLVLNNFLKDIKTPPTFDLIIFDNKGKIKYRDKKFPYSAIIMINPPMSRLYFITENEDLAFIDLKELITQ